jgi:SanA protein
MLRRTLRLLRWPLVLTGVLVMTIAGINLWMTLRCQSRIHTDPANVPRTDVALVLGTTKLIGDRMNIHFRVRMDAASSLYKAGRVRHFLVSGDNSTSHYNEPRDMKEALMERGVPGEAITCDYAGFRTLDSVVRARDIFGVNECVVISDDFHLARALWIADLHGIKATAYYEDAVRWGMSGKSRVREWFARVKAVADEITGTEPKFGGEKVPLRLSHVP